VTARRLWISEFRIHCRIVGRYRHARVLLAGDAAHLHSPTGGQSIATGIQDATNLAWKLARVVRGAPQSLLDTYEEERLPKTREVLKETDRTTTIFFAPTRLTRLLRDFVVLPVLRNSWVQKRMFAKLSQLHVTYRAAVCRGTRMRSVGSGAPASRPATAPRMLRSRRHAAAK
jgi:4,5-epoxidase